MINAKYDLFSLMMGSPTEEWGKPPSTGLMFCQTSTREVLYTELVNNNMKKVNCRIMHVGDNILAAAAEARINEK